MASDPGRNPNFSRQWTEPEPIGDLADRQVQKIGRKAIRHWLEKAERLNGEDRTAALECADQIRELCKLSWSDLFDQRRRAA